MCMLNKTTFLTILLGSFIATSYAEEPSDSTSVELQEVVVEGDVQHVSPTAVVYTPDRRQKQAATNAIDLLRKIGIPQLQVDVMGESATTVSGQALSYFINYVPATSEELSGMRTKDVKRVEYLDYPSDPRFRGAEHVINYIMVKYEYGGYTKLTDKGWLANKYTNNTFSGFSKFVYKKMTYDIYLGHRYQNAHHLGNKNEQVYRLLDSSGQLREVSRVSDTNESFYLDNAIPVNFRAAYVNDKIQIDNRVWFNFKNAPHNYQAGGLTVTPSTNEDYRYTLSKSNISRNVGWNGSYFFMLPKKWSISIGTSFNYSSVNMQSLYQSSLMSESINNDAVDRTSYGQLRLFLNKTFSGNHQVWANIMQIYSASNVHYVAYGDENRFRQNFGGIGLGYSATFGDVVRLQADGGFSYDWSKTNGEVSVFRQPYVHFNLNYAPNQTNSVGLWFQYATNTPDSNEKSPNVIRMNELLYAKGNPALKPSDHITFNLDWWWTPRSFFTGSVNVSYYRLFNAARQTYSLYDNGTALIRSSANDGDYQTFWVGTNFTFYLLNRSLQIQAGPSYVYNNLSGENPISKHAFRGTIDVTYYIKGFYASLAFSSPYRWLQSDGSYDNYKKPEYLLTLGWANNDWNIRVNLKNMFESTWIEGSSEFESPYFTAINSQYGINRHRQISFSASYTFGYGRKVGRNNEIGEGTGSMNSIMK